MDKFEHNNRNELTYAIVSAAEDEHLLRGKLERQISFLWKVQSYIRYMKSPKGSYEWKYYLILIGIVILIFSCIVGVLQCVIGAV